MITQEELQEQLEYDPTTGIFTRTMNCSKHTYKKGDVVGHSHAGNYLGVSLQGRIYSLHRLAFLYMTGSIPNLIDHRDRNKLNNIWNNLRPATRSINSFNIDIQSNNTSGHKGVTYNKRAHKWQASIMLNRKQIYLGVFSSIDSAVTARKAGELKYYGK